MAALTEVRKQGVCWPISSNGKISTTEVSKRVWCACIDGMSKDETETSEKAKCESLISRIQAEKDWRHKYHVYIKELTVLMAGTSQSALSQATSGLDSLYNEFSFLRGEETFPLLEAVNGKSNLILNKVNTTKINGNGTINERNNAIIVPIKINNVDHELKGDDLIQQAQAWSDYGCCEATVTTSIASVASLETSQLPIQNRIFCMLGGTSELCPTRPLLSLGATVAVIARPGAKLTALMEFANTTPGTLLLPQLDSEEQKGPGLDLITHTPEVAQWLKSVASSDTNTMSASPKKLCVGSYVYLDGEQHVRASMAMDVICKTLAEELGVDRVELTQLASPATAHLWPSDALTESETRWNNRSWKARLARFESNKSVNLGVTIKNDRNVFNGLLVVQGPNYALAKTLQLWRCVIARNNGQLVSANFAPPARTDSVLHAPSMTAALNGMQAMEPLAVLDAPTACSFMTALLLSDLLPDNNNENNNENDKNTASESTQSQKNPANPNVKLDHPWDMFTFNAFHGGNWRCGYAQGSIGTAAFVLGSMNYETGIAASIKK